MAEEALRLDDPEFGEKVHRAMERSVEGFQKRLCLPDDFFEVLSTSGDDWTFVVKGHALLEAVINELLVSALGRRSLENFIAKRQLVAFKLPMAKDLGLLDTVTEAFIRCLCEIRNRCVHNVKNVSFSLNEYVGGLSQGDAEKLCRVATLGLFLMVDLETFRGDPKRVIAEALKIAVGRLNLQAVVQYSRQGALKAFLMFRPTNELTLGLWNMCKDAAPEI